jgi:hypothetical protein
MCAYNMLVGSRVKPEADLTTSTGPSINFSQHFINL